MSGLYRCAEVHAYVICHTYRYLATSRGFFYAGFETGFYLHGSVTCLMVHEFNRMWGAQSLQMAPLVSPFLRQNPVAARSGRRDGVPESIQTKSFRLGRGAFGSVQDKAHCRVQEEDRQGGRPHTCGHAARQLHCRVLRSGGQDGGRAKTCEIPTDAVKSRTREKNLIHGILLQMSADPARRRSRLPGWPR